jgi:hypothetical protein
MLADAVRFVRETKNCLFDSQETAARPVLRPKSAKMPKDEANP